MEENTADTSLQSNLSSENTDTSSQRNLNSLKRHCGPQMLAMLDDPLTIEIMLNPDGSLWHERLGEPVKKVGTMERCKAEALFRCVAACLDKTITRDSPQLDGEFPLDKSRFSGALPPVVSAPMFAIRRKASSVYTLDQYVESQIMTPHQRDVLAQAVAAHKNILVAGGTSSGKTTLTNALIDEISKSCPNERLIIIEDTGEIQCTAPNVVFLHTSTTVSMTMLLKQALRLRPERIFVGEVRDHAALDLLDAWNTGHEGGIATVHANNAVMALSRLRGLILRNEFAPREVEQVIGEAVHIVVFIQKTPAGRRVKEVLGINGYTDGGYDLQTLA